MMWHLACSIVGAINAAAMWSAYGFWGWLLAILGAVFVMCASYWEGLSRK